MIRGEESDKLKLSFKMAAGNNSGIPLEDFRQLIRACSNTMSSLVAPPSSISSDEDIDRLFHELSSDEGEHAEGIPRMISMQAYQDAAQSNDEFLACLGLDYRKNAPTDGCVRKVARNLTTCSTTTGLGGELPESRRATSRDIPLAGPGSVVVTAAQLQDLRERLNSLRQAIHRPFVNPLIDKTEQAPLPPISSGETPSERQAPAPLQDDPPPWWPFQKCTLPLTEDGSVRVANVDGANASSGYRVAGPSTVAAMPRAVPAIVLDKVPSAGSGGDGSADEVSAELDKVLAWACDLDGIDAMDDSSMTCAHTSDEGGVFYDATGIQVQANANVSRRNPKQFSKSYSTATVGAASNIHKDGKRTPQNVAATSRRHRKRHRLLGPKKGLAVHFGHENWNMVLSMMIGIRMSVGRSRHEAAREIQPVDFQMKEKFSILPRLANVFDTSVGKRVAMTRFYDYAPVVFQRIRTTFGIHHDDYVKSIGPEELLGNLVLGNLASLSELSSEGKSGAFFYYTSDGNFMIKTVAPKEQKLLKNMLTNYYEHIMKYPGTLIVRFLGLHCLRVWKQDKYFGYERRQTRKVYFVVMANMFNTPFEIHRRYDIKGSWVGRSTSAAEGKDHTVALKDVDFTSNNECFRIGPERKAKLLSQIEIDSAFLASSNIIDYSLLAGIHDIGVDGKTDSSDEHDLDSAAMIADIINLDYDAARTGQCTGGGKIRMAEGASESDVVVPIHQRDSGGMISDDKKHLYFVGIIDILTPFDTFKRLEHTVKAMSNDWRGVSCCPPPYYAERFSKFIRAAFE
jgi:hypothetical protein